MSDSGAREALVPRYDIQVLPEGLANRIAAGEVVERPSSVVKELIENAVDAEAQNITVSVKNAGFDEILISDDGWGMDEEDVQTALRRHATSKLRTAEDLMRILHFGFRGEALPSIASVSRLEIVSKREDRDHGIRYRVDGGKANGPEPAQRERGTTIRIRSLFYNVPARRKFLRTPATEYGHIVRVFKQFALTYPEYSWKLEKDGKEEYTLPSADLRGRIGQIFGEEAMADLHPVDYRVGDVFASGVVGGTSMFRKSRGDQFLYVNRRPIQSGSLHHAVVNGFGPLIERGQYPFYVMNLRLDPEEFDVNVHPAKHEVRFRDEGMAYRAVLVSVRDALGLALRSGGAPVQMPLGQREQSAERPQAGHPEMELLLGKAPRRPDEALYAGGGGGRDAAGVTAPAQGRAAVSVPAPPLHPIKKHDPGQDFDSNAADVSGQTGTAVGVGTPESTADSHFEVSVSGQQPAPSASLEEAAQRLNVWQVHRTYILSQTKSGLVIIDQHVAHERILFEKALAAMRQRPWSGQRLLFPVEVKLDPAESNLMEELVEPLARMGFEVEPAGTHTWAIHSVPAGLRIRSEERLLRDMLGDYRQEYDVRLEPQESLAASFACKAAIKAGDPLKLDEMNALIDELFTTEYPFVCPHGRPVVVNLTLSELHRLFGRE
jgi:DNA mismatch repair protein MutL